MNGNIIGENAVKMVRAEVVGQGRVSFERDWYVEARFPAGELFKTGAHLARTEGAIFHAEALEARLPKINPNARYRLGRMRNGCQTAYVFNKT